MFDDGGHMREPAEQPLGSVHSRRLHSGGGRQTGSCLWVRS